MPRASQLVFGCASLGSRYDRSESLRALAIAYDHGINVFDTARSYGYGESEGIVGEFVKGRRERVILSTKGGIRAARPARNGRVLRSVARKVFAFAPSLRAAARGPLSRQHSHGHFEPLELRRSVEESLRELGTDRIDLFFLHDVPAERASADEILGLLDALKGEGKVLLSGPASSATTLAELSASPKALGSAIQFPGSAARFRKWPPAFVKILTGPRTTRPVRFANRPFEGGGPLEAELERRLRAVGPLHEVLLRLPLAGGICDAVVSAMLNPEHIVKNCRALADSTLPDTELASLAQSLLNETEEDACSQTS
jgi:aryl-alcohol dehydrogenase-like predicted oxidoreductase